MLAGDKLVRFLQGGAFACAANFFKKHRQQLLTVHSRTRMLIWCFVFVLLVRFYMK